MREIPLGQSGLVTIVDDDVYEWAVCIRWYVHRRGLTAYARREPAPEIFSRRLHCQILGVLGIDHINGNGLDNRRVNLRRATQSQNRMNARKRTVWNGGSPTSRFKGVSFYSGKWVAYCGTAYLGRFNSEDDAALAYNVKASREYGKFARLNDVR